MKKTLLAFFFIVLSCQLLLAQEKMYISSNNGVNLREGAGTNYKVKKSIPPGSQVKVLSNDGEWAKVEHESETGYVSSQFLTENKPQNNRSSSPDNNNQNNRSSSPGSGSSNNSNNNRSNNNANRSNNNSSSSYNRNWGIGLRGGDPSGLTVKKYNGNTAWEFNIGHTAYWGRSGYHDAFYSYRPYEGYRFVEIRDYHVNRALGIQLRHLWQKDLNIDGLPGLQWYYGLGGQLKNLNVWYRYKYEDQWGKKYDNFISTANFINLGIDGILGLEYTFEEIPISVFTDINVFLEVFRNTFDYHPQGGIGIRYNF